MKLKYFVLFLLINSTLLKAQISKTPVVFPSPNGVIIDRVKDVDVDLYRGTPNLTFDLHELKGNSIGESIRLFYDAAGVRPDDHPGPSGLNFKFISGGVISRSVQGYPDELDNNSLCEKHGFYFTSSFVSGEDWASDEKLLKHCKHSLPQIWSIMLQPGSENYFRKDTEPDIFNFSVNNISGRFYFDQNREIKVQCNKKVKVVFDEVDFIDNHLKAFVTVNTGPNAYSKTFGKFTIIDESGTRYVFGKDAIEYSDEFRGIMPRTGGVAEGPIIWFMPNRGFFCFATSWYLKDVISADGSESITYSYTRGAFIANIQTSVSRSETEYRYGIAKWGGISADGKVISPVYLKSIDFPKKRFRIDFEYSKSNDLQYDKNILKNMSLVSSTSDEKLLDILNYTYGLDFFGSEIPNGDNLMNKIDRFVWPKLDKISIKETSEGRELKSILFYYQENSYERLKLKKVEIKESAFNKTKSYNFYYNIKKLRPYLSCFNDITGYNNDKPLPGIGTWSQVLGTNTYPGDHGMFNYDPDINAVKATVEASLDAEILNKVELATGASISLEYEPNSYSKVVNDSRNETISQTGKIGGLRIKKISMYDEIETLVSEKEYYYVTGYQAGANIASLPSSGVLNISPRLIIGPYDYADYWQKKYYHKYSMPSVPIALDEEMPRVGYTEVIERIKNNGYTKYVFTNFDNGYFDEPPINSLNGKNITFVPYTSKAFERGKLLQRRIYDESNSIQSEEEYKYKVLGNPETDYVRSLFGLDQEVFMIGRDRAACAIKRYFYVIKVEQVKKALWDKNGKAFVVKENFTYDSNYNVKIATNTTSEGDSVKTIFSYNTEYSTAGSNAPKVSKPIEGLKKLEVCNVLDGKVEETMMLKKIGSSDWKVISGKVFTYHPDYPKLENTYYLKVTSPILLSNYKPFTITYPFSNMDERYSLESSYTYGNNQLIQFSAPGRMISYIWGSDGVSPIAKIENSPPDRVAFTSFERGEKGNWNFGGSCLTSIPAKTGSWYYALTPSSSITKSLFSGKYIIEFWSKNNVNVTGGTVRDLGSYADGQGWVHYKKEISSNAGFTVTLSGESNIDDLRLYPVDAMMTTYTYNLMYSLTSETDANNRTTYYEYDNFEALRLVRDEKNNILKFFEYDFKRR
jgi:YD repeat-containing protein